MEFVPLEVTVISAHDLDGTDPCDFAPAAASAVEVYAVVYVVMGDDIYAMQRTPADDVGGCNPAWCFTARFLVPRDGRHLQGLHFSLQCRCPRGDYGVGDVRVSLEELLRLVSKSAEGPPWGAKFSHPVTTPFSHPVTTPWGWRQGTLRFRLRYGEEEGAGRTDAAAAERLPPARRLSRLMDGVGLVAWLLVGLLLRRILCEVHLPRPPPPPAPPSVICVYRYLETSPPSAPPAVMGTGFNWPVLLTLGGLLLAIHYRVGRGHA